MSTCRLLYHEGAKVIIKDPVGLETERRLLSFLSFLHAEDDMIRCTYLRRLDLWTLGLSVAAAEALVFSLAHMTALDTLVITHPELTLASHPALPQSLASLRSLKHLTLSHTNTLGYNLLQSSHFSLVTAHISINHSVRDSKFHPVLVMDRHRMSLEELSWEYDGYHDFHPKPTSGTIAYPRLRRLSITEGQSAHFLKGRMPFFPNLTHLRLLPDRVDRRSPLRREHVSDWMMRDAAAHGAWLHLEQLTGSLKSISALGLASHIPHLTLEDAGSTQHPDQLTSVLSRALPLNLKIEFVDGHFENAVSRFSSAMAEPGASALEGIEAVFGVSIEEQKNVRLSATMEGFFSSLLDLEHLQCLALTLRYSGTARKPREWDSTAYVTRSSNSTTIPTLLPQPRPKRSLRGGAPHLTLTNPNDSPTALSRVAIGGSLRSVPEPDPPLTATEAALEHFDVVELTNRVVATFPRLRDVQVTVARPRHGSRRVATIKAGLNGEKDVRYVEYIHE
ncbi:hypothetical protein C8Q74DRAFT_1374435 [Fomes fomentarius]|nr:hypothetical protein C8Q74DRAFT_1374435 [Fomes fomentarius]